MNPPDLDLKLDAVRRLEAFEAVFGELRAVDPEIGANIETALRNQLAANHDLLVQAEGNPDRLRYALYREGVELNSHIATFLRYSETMAQREAALWKFALGATDQFFDLVFDALDDYFAAKQEIIEKLVDDDSSWYSGMRDTAKQAGIVLNVAKRGFARTVKKVGEIEMDEHETPGKVGAALHFAKQGVARAVGKVAEIEVGEGDMVDVRTVVERLLANHLGPEVIEADISRIMEEASRRYQEAWQREIQAQTPDLSDMRAFASQGADSSLLKVGFEIGRAEQTLLVGLGGALVGTLGLAAGWHTITYSLLYVFPPAAIFAMLATAAVAVLTKDHAARKRKQAIRDAVVQYHRHFLTQIDTAPIEALEERTLRRAMTDQARNLVGEVMARWNEVISGKLTVDHYRLLNAAATAHLLAVEDCLKILEGY